MSTPGKSDFLNRCMRYCSGAERCTQDVVKKLVTWEAPEDEYEVILETLRKEKFLDDTRYANSFVADKWRLDQWGTRQTNRQIPSPTLQPLPILVQACTS